MKSVFARLLVLLAACWTLGPAMVRGATDQLVPAPADCFTIAVIPDTQAYVGRGTKRTPHSSDPVSNEIFLAETAWLAAHLGDQRIVFVSHVGDIVDMNNDNEWTIARTAMDKLHGLVPYSVVVGNHDMTRDGDSSLFQKYFGAERFKAFPWYGGCFGPARPSPAISGNNANSYQLFSAGGLEFIHIALENNAPDDVLAWANDLLEKYAGRRALVTTHMDVGTREKPATDEGYVSDPKGRMVWTKTHGKLGNSPQQIWDKLYRRHANLGFVFSGDQSRATAHRISETGLHGNTVHCLLSDYGSTGALRLYRFFPARNQVEAITYNPFSQQVVTTTPHVKERSHHQFTLAYPMRGAAGVAAAQH